VKPAASQRSTAEFRFILDERRTNQVRLLLSNACLLTTDDRLLSSRTAMAGAELVDCAMHATPSAELCLGLQVDSAQRTIRLTIELGPLSEKVTDLEKLIAEVGRGDEREAYLRALKAAQDDRPTPLELRLARIRFEGKMALRSERAAARHLLIIAEAHAASGSGPSPAEADLPADDQ
jgi:hypothetical protein